MSEGKQVSIKSLNRFISCFNGTLEVDTIRICEPPLRQWINKRTGDLVAYMKLYNYELDGRQPECYIVNPNH